jgi:hypothetical protein
MSSALDQWVARLQNLDGFNIGAIIKEGQATEPWMQVNSAEIVKELVIDELNLRQQVESVTAQIQMWGRLCAKAKRVWELQERLYRKWRSEFYLECIKPPKGKKVGPGWTVTAKGDPKAPTEKIIEALYRSHDQYQVHQANVEAAEEAFNSANAILEAFRAQKDMLRSYAYRAREDGAARLSV